MTSGDHQVTPHGHPTNKGLKSRNFATSVPAATTQERLLAIFSGQTISPYSGICYKSDHTPESVSNITLDGSNPRYLRVSFSTINAANQNIGVQYFLRFGTSFQSKVAARVLGLQGSAVVQSTHLAAESVTGSALGIRVIMDAQISGSANISDDKLATITSSRKVSGNAIQSGTIGGIHP